MGGGYRKEGYTIFKIYRYHSVDEIMRGQVEGQF